MSRGQVCKLWKSGKKSPKDNIAFELIYREFQTCKRIGYMSSNVLFFWNLAHSNVSGETPGGL